MLDKYLPQYLIELTTVTDPQGDSRTSTLNTSTGGTLGGSSKGRIYRNRTPQGFRALEETEYPYILVGEATDFDFGQTAQEDMLREIGKFNVCVVGRNYNQIDQIYRDLVDALKKVRNMYLPSASAPAKMWVQCIILEHGFQFEHTPNDGTQLPYVGYCIPIQSGYDP